MNVKIAPGRFRVKRLESCRRVFMRVPDLFHVAHLTQDRVEDAFWTSEKKSRFKVLGLIIFRNARLKPVLGGL